MTKIRICWKEFIFLHDNTFSLKIITGLILVLLLCAVSLTHFAFSESTTKKPYSNLPEIKPLKLTKEAVSKPLSKSTTKKPYNNLPDVKPLKLFDLSNSAIKYQKNPNITPSLDSLVHLNQPQVRYKLFFVNSLDNKCTNRNIQAMNFYDDVVKAYFSLYKIQYVSSPSQCVTAEQSSLMDQEINSHDLVIVITDVLLSETHLYEDNHAWGYYRHIDNNHNLIVSSSYSLSTKSGSSAWTLTHELSHYILKIQNQPESIWIDWVHNIQAQVTQCKGETSWDSYYGSMTDCPKSLYKTILVEGKNVDVMQLYGQSSSYSYDTRTVLLLNQIPIQAKTGQLITFSGSLKNTEGLPVRGATIYIKDNDFGSRDETLTSAITDSNGMFSTSWYATNTDFWDSTVEVYAVFEGDLNIQKAKTPIYNLTILK
jgi:hypothetical protein